MSNKGTPYGCKHPCFKPNTSETGVVLGELVSANLTVTNATGELFSNDRRSRAVTEFASGKMEVETDLVPDAAMSVVYGSKVVDGVMTHNVGDSAPSGIFAFYQVEMDEDGVKYYECDAYPNCKAAMGNKSSQTKGSNYTFQTAKTSFDISPVENGDWYMHKTFGDEASAKAWVENLCGISTAYKVSVSAQGTGTGKNVDKLGEFYVPAGSDFDIAIEGYASVTAAYDNGSDVASAITGGDGTYTLSDVAADHTIAIIF